MIINNLRGMILDQDNSIKNNRKRKYNKKSNKLTLLRQSNNNNKIKIINNTTTAMNNSNNNNNNNNSNNNINNNSNKHHSIDNAHSLTIHHSEIINNKIPQRVTIQLNRNMDIVQGMSSITTRMTNRENRRY